MAEFLAVGPSLGTVLLTAFVLGDAVALYALSGKPSTGQGESPDEKNVRLLAKVKRAVDEALSKFPGTTAAAPAAAPAVSPTIPVSTTATVDAALDGVAKSQAKLDKILAAVNDAIVRLVGIPPPVAVTTANARPEDPDNNESGEEEKTPSDPMTLAAATPIFKDAIDAAIQTGGSVTPIEDVIKKCPELVLQVWGPDKQSTLMFIIWTAIERAKADKGIPLPSGFMKKFRSALGSPGRYTRRLLGSIADGILSTRTWFVSDRKGVSERKAKQGGFKGPAALPANAAAATAAQAAFARLVKTCLYTQPKDETPPPNLAFKLLMELKSDPALKNDDSVPELLVPVVNSFLWWRWHVLNAPRLYSGEVAVDAEGLFKRVTPGTQIPQPFMKFLILRSLQASLGEPKATSDDTAAIEALFGHLRDDDTQVSLAKQEGLVLEFLKTDEGAKQVNVVDGSTGMSLLMYAAKGLMVKAVNKLMDMDADISKTDDIGNTVFHYIADTQRSRSEYIKNLLTKASADKLAIDAAETESSRRVPKKDFTPEAKIRLANKRAEEEYLKDPRLTREAREAYLAAKPKGGRTRRRTQPKNKTRRGGGFFDTDRVTIAKRLLKYQDKDEIETILARENAKGQLAVETSKARDGFLDTSISVYKLIEPLSPSLILKGNKKAYRAKFVPRTGRAEAIAEAQAKTDAEAQAKAAADADAEAQAKAARAARAETGVDQHTALVKSLFGGPREPPPPPGLPGPPPPPPPAFAPPPAAETEFKGMVLARMNYASTKKSEDYKTLENARAAFITALAGTRVPAKYTKETIKNDENVIKGAKDAYNKIYASYDQSLASAKGASAKGVRDVIAPIGTDWWNNRVATSELGIVLTGSPASNDAMEIIGKSEVYAAASKPAQVKGTDGGDMLRAAYETALELGAKGVMDPTSIIAERREFLAAKAAAAAPPAAAPLLPPPPPALAASAFALPPAAAAAPPAAAPAAALALPAPALPPALAVAALPGPPPGPPPPRPQPPWKYITELEPGDILSSEYERITNPVIKSEWYQIGIKSVRTGINASEDLAVYRNDRVAQEIKNEKTRVDEAYDIACRAAVTNAAATATFAETPPDGWCYYSALLKSGGKFEMPNDGKQYHYKTTVEDPKELARVTKAIMLGEKGTVSSMWTTPRETMNYETNSQETITLDQYIAGMATETSGGNPKYWAEGDVNSRVISDYFGRIIGIYHQASGGDKTKLSGYNPVPDVYCPVKRKWALDRSPYLLAFTGAPANHFDAFVPSAAVPNPLPSTTEGQALLAAKIAANKTPEPEKAPSPLEPSLAQQVAAVAANAQANMSKTIAEKRARAEAKGVTFAGRRRHKTPKRRRVGKARKSTFRRHRKH